MTAPDWIIKLFIILGLKTSEEKQLKRDIAASEERIRSLNQQGDRIVAEIQSIEAECREAEAEYDTLQGVARETARIRLDNLRKAQARFTERNTLLDHQLNAEQAIRHNLQLQLEHLHSRSADDLKDTTETKKELIAVENENAAAIAKLDNTSLPQQTKNTDDDNDFESAI